MAIIRSRFLNKYYNFLSQESIDNYKTIKKNQLVNEKGFGLSRLKVAGIKKYNYIILDLINVLSLKTKKLNNKFHF